MGYAIPISDVADLISELMTQTTDLSQTSATQASYYVAPEPRDPSAPENRTGARLPPALPDHE